MKYLHDLDMQMGRYPDMKPADSDPVFYKPDTDDVIPEKNIPIMTILIFLFLLLFTSLINAFCGAMTVFGLLNVAWVINHLIINVCPEIKRLTELLNKSKDQC